MVKKTDDKPRGLAPAHSLPDDGEGIYARRRKAAAETAQTPGKGQLPAGKHAEATIRHRAAGRSASSFDRAKVSTLDKQQTKGGATKRVSPHRRKV